MLSSDAALENNELAEWATSNEFQLAHLLAVITDNLSVIMTVQSEAENFFSQYKGGPKYVSVLSTKRYSTSTETLVCYHSICGWWILNWAFSKAPFSVIFQLAKLESVCKFQLAQQEIN